MAAGKSQMMDVTIYQALRAQFCGQESSILRTSVTTQSRIVYEHINIVKIVKGSDNESNRIATSTVREGEEAVITLVASLVKGIDMLAAIACNMLIMIAVLSLFPPDHCCEPLRPALLDCNTFVIPNRFRKERASPIWGGTLGFW